MLHFETVEQLLEDTKQVVRRHLNDEELGAYSDHAVGQSARARMEAHLAGCWICKRRLAMMREILEADLLGGLKAAFSALFEPIRIPLGSEAAGTQKLSGEEHGVWWSIVENEWGDREVRLGSYRLKPGQKILVKVGNLSETVELKKKGENQVGAEVVFTSEAWESLPEDAELQILDPASEEGENHGQ